MSIEGLTQEEEDIQTKIFKLEDRVASLEQTLNSMVSDAKQVLTDVRAILSELENPMNYLKGLGIDEVMLSMAEQITEAKLKEFMDRKISALIKTMIESKVKDTITSKVKEVLDEELKKSLGEAAQDVKKLVEMLNSQDFLKALEEKISQVINPEKIKQELLEEVTKELNTKIEEVKSSLNNPMIAQQVGHEEHAAEEARIFEPKIEEHLPHGVSLPQFLGSYCLISLLGRKRLDKILSNLIDMGLADKGLVSLILRLSYDFDGESISSLFDEAECYVLSHVLLKLIRDGSGLLELYALHLLIRKCVHLFNLVSKLKSKVQDRGG